jgi:hypothetical protein
MFTALYVVARAEAIPVEGGSIAGICLASFNIITVLLSIFITKMYYSDEKPEDEN